MRVLVTRPALSGARTAKKLAARGHEPLLLPLTTAVHDPEATQAALDASTGAIAVTSAEAVRALSALAVARHLGRPLFAVGKATAETAADAGFSIVHHAEGDGVALAGLVASHRLLLGDQPLIYLAGFPRASGFEAALSAQGIAFDTVQSYRMAPIEPSEAELADSFGDRPVEAILFYSHHTAERFLGLSYVARHLDRLRNTRLLCLSATIATIVPHSLRSQVEIAATPEEESLLRLLDADADLI